MLTLNLYECTCRALSHNPQLWTSYSGYFREVTGMCFAVRNQIERELIENLFYNLTLTQLMNNNMLKQHSLDLFELHAKEMEAWKTLHQEQRILNNHTTLLLSTTSKLDMGMQSTLHNLTQAMEMIQNLEMIQTKVKLQMQTWKEETQLWINETKLHTTNTSVALISVKQSMLSFLNQIAELMMVQNKAQSGIEELNSAIQNSKEKMIEFMKSQDGVVEKLNAITIQIDSHHQSATKNITKVAESIKELNGQIDSAKQSFFTIYQFSNAFLHWRLLAFLLLTPFLIFSRINAIVIAFGSVALLMTYWEHVSIWSWEKLLLNIQVSSTMFRIIPMIISVLLLTSFSIFKLRKRKKKLFDDFRIKFPSLNPQGKVTKFPSQIGQVPLMYPRQKQSFRVHFVGQQRQINAQKTSHFTALL
ncbi:hypothetical protein HMI54_004674 [Coelomomyces lativittatus]|nr:hypothetical protein HMI54_004674 [Coelomomyces lativittatus]